MKAIGVLLLCTLLCCCKGSNDADSSIKCYNIEHMLKVEAKNLCIDSIFKDISIIPLETSDDILIKKIINIHLYNDLLFVIHVDRCSVFDLKGNYLYDIGKRGNGPGEFTASHPQLLFFSGDIVGLCETYHKTLFYTIDGQFKYDITHFTAYETIKNIKQNVFVGIVGIESERDANRLLFFDIKGNEIDSVQHYRHLSREDNVSWYIPDDANLFVYNNNVYLKEGYNDTTFLISHDLKLIPEYIIATGKRSVNYEVRVLNPEKYGDGARSVIDFESDRYIILRNRGPGGFSGDRILIDKKNGKIESVLFKYNEDMAKLFEDHLVLDKIIDNTPILKSIPPYFRICGVSEDGKTVFGYEVLIDKPYDNPVIIMATIKE